MNSALRATLMPALVLLVALFCLPGSVLLSAAAEKPAAPEKNPPGDIPDSQVFVDYQSPLGFTLKVPEGWSRTDLPTGAKFADKYNTITINIAVANKEPTPDRNDPRVMDLLSGGHAVEVTSVKSAKLKSGSAIVVAYAANSDPNPVTNKQIRLEGSRYLFYKAAELATLDLTAPLGADNVDQWLLMANSFRWK